MRRTLVALAAVVSLALGAGPADARVWETYAPATECLPPPPPSTFLYLPPGGCGVVYDWDVDPNYDGPTYASESEAAADDPPPPAPVTAALPTWRNLYDWPNGHGYVGWHEASSAPSLYGMQSALGGNYGLWLWPLGGDYADGNFAEWTYTAPGTTRIQKVSLSFAYRNKLLAHHCLVVGLRTAAGVVAQNEWCKPVTPPDSQRDVQVTLVDPSTNPTSTVLFFKIRMDCKNQPGCTKHIPMLDPLQTAGTARLKFVDMTLVDDDLPVVTAYGPFVHLDQRYIDGRQPYDVTVDATDAGAGIERSWIERFGAGTIVSGSAPCDRTHHTPELDNRICPQRYVFTSNVSTLPFPEGTNTFVARSIDPALNVGQSSTWLFYIDRTGPAIGNVGLNYYDTAARDARVVFEPGADPNLPDGVPGSGVQLFRYRYEKGGVWSDWSNAKWQGFHIRDVGLGENVAVEVREFDAVGNSSSVASATFTVEAIGERGPAPDDPPCLEDSNDRPISCFDVDAGFVPEEPGDDTCAGDDDLCNATREDAIAAGLTAKQLDDNLQLAIDEMRNPDANGLPDFGTPSFHRATADSLDNFTGWVAYFEYIVYPATSSQCRNNPIRDNGFCGKLLHVATFFRNGEPHLFVRVSRFNALSGGNWPISSGQMIPGRNNPPYKWYQARGPIPDRWKKSSTPGNMWHNHVGWHGFSYTGFQRDSDPSFAPGKWRINPFQRYDPNPNAPLHVGGIRNAFLIHGGTGEHRFDNPDWGGTHGCIRINPEAILRLKGKWDTLTDNKRIKPGPLLLVDYSRS
jgi:hypothetical protein